jgi:nucleoside-diphosphate-sugar epimerase
MSLRPHETTVAVTGANGFVASEIVSQLLLRGYKVHGTVRDPTDTEKVGHLSRFTGANNLTLFKAELTDSTSFEEAFKGVDVVLHVASPLPSRNEAEDPEKAYLDPAIKGTTNVLDTIARCAPKVKTVVLTSSIASISSNGGLLPETHVFTEEDWSPCDRLRELKRWYALSKTLAEKAAWEHSLITSKQVKLVVINPGWVVGRITSVKHISGTPNKWLSALKGEWKTIPNRGTSPVDVVDVAWAHIRAFEDPDAEGRYACVFGTLTHEEVVAALNRVGTFPNLPTTLEDKPYSQGVDLWNCRKLEKLIGGWQSLDQTCRDMAASYASFGLI